MNCEEDDSSQGREDTCQHEGNETGGPIAFFSGWMSDSEGVDEDCSEVTQHTHEGPSVSLVGNSVW